MLKVATDTGEMKTVRAAWLNDAVQWIPVSCAWTAEADGDLVQSEGCISSSDLDIISVTPFSITFGWSAPGQIGLRLFLNGQPYSSSDLVLNADSGTQTIGSLAPSTAYSLQLEVKYGAGVGDTSLSAVLQATTDAMPVPTGLRSTDIGNSSYKLVWNPVSGASDYSVRNAANDTEYSKTNGRAELVRTGLPSGTRFSDVVRAIHVSGKQSANSNTSTQTTLSNFPAGTYYFYASSADTWSSGARAWRGTGQGKLWHGDGGKFGASGGSRYAFFFGYRHDSTGLSFAQFFASKGQLNYTVTRTQVYMKRSSEQHGVWSAQSCKWHIHAHASKPSHPNAEWGHMSGTLNLGEGKWIDIDKHYGRDLARGVYHGIAWGGTPYYSSGAGYMLGPTTLTGGSPMGAIAITVA